MRVDAARESACLRQAIVALGAGLRDDMADMGASLRPEISQLRAEAAAGRVELFKWCFLFWNGQVIAIGGLLGATVQLPR